ncbi:MAG: PQQ-binding-like beta-propeller repeat protein [Idiomarina sp.]|nr:PQQ-binding-like beta-propeller repeat protein [Idiomarina sp.]
MRLLWLICLIILEILFGSTAEGASWRTFKGDESRNVQVPLNFPSTLTLQQSQLRVPSTVTASPILSDEVLFVASDSGVLYAFDMKTRTLKWAFDSGGSIRSTPALTDNSVYFLSSSGYFFALNKSNGVLKWQFKTGGEHRFAAYGYLGVDHHKPVEDPWDLLQSSPLIVDDRVIFGSSDRHLYALNRESGKRLWAYQTGGEVHSSPALAGDLVIVGSWDGKVYAVNHSSGEPAWSFATQVEQQYSVWRGIKASPTVFEDMVYIGSRDGFLYALEAGTGNQVWQYDMARSWVVPTVVVDQEQVYLGSSDTGLMLAVNRLTGEEIWRHRVGAWMYSSPLLFNDVVISASMLGHVVALSKVDGRVIWQDNLGPLIADNFAILNEQQELNGRMGNGTWQDGLQGMMARVLASGGFMGSPIWDSGRLIYVSTAGDIYVWQAN